MTCDKESNQNPSENAPLMTWSIIRLHTPQQLLRRFHNWLHSIWSRNQNSTVFILQWFQSLFTLQCLHVYRIIKHENCNKTPANKQREGTILHTTTTLQVTYATCYFVLYLPLWANRPKQQWSAPACSWRMICQTLSACDCDKRFGPKSWCPSRFISSQSSLPGEGLCSEGGPLTWWPERWSVWVKASVHPTAKCHMLHLGALVHPRELFPHLLCFSIYISGTWNSQMAFVGLAQPNLVLDFTRNRKIQWPFTERRLRQLTNTSVTA